MMMTVDTMTRRSGILRWWETTVLREDDDHSTTVVRARALLGDHRESIDHQGEVMQKRN